MEAFELILLLLAAVLLSSVIDQIVPKISSPLIQIGLGLLIALFAFSPIEITVDPELFLVLFIAPLLFYDAKEADKVNLWKNHKPVISLAIGLVLVTVLIIGFSVHWLIPSIPLAAAFALGGALGPTDAVAVASLSKEVNLNQRQKSLLSGEFLINDASGIVSFQFAIAAAITGTFSLLDASASFLIEFVGGIAVGLIFGLVARFAVSRVRSWGLENTTFHVLFELFTPFIVYLLAHALGTSGILAVVAAGLMWTINPPEIAPSISRHNIVSSSAWRVLSFTLNGIVFVLLGAQLPAAMEASWNSTQIDNFMLLGYIVIITVLLMGVRFIWITALDASGMKKREGRRYRKSDLRDSLVTTLAGAKGAITLSIVLTIPYLILTDSGYVGFPQRSLIIFLASGVIILTLTVATFIVPLIAPKKDDTSAKVVDESEVLIEILRNVIEELTAQQTSDNKLATQTVIRSYKERIKRVKDYSNIEDELNVTLRIKALRWEQDFVLEKIDTGEFDPVTGYRYINRLAHIQNLLKHKSDNRWIIQNALRRAWRIVISAWHHLLDALPGKTPQSTRDEAFKEMQVLAVENVLEKLEGEMKNPEAPSEDVAGVMLEYQRILGALKSSRPSVSAITKSGAKMADVGRTGLTLELEQIQEMYDAERISRATAKRMRENVYLMQIDLEDHI